MITLVYLHTVLDNPNDHQRQVIQDLAASSDGLIVTIESVIDFLESALSYREKLVTVTSPYIDDIPLLHLGDKFNNGGNSQPLAKFSWAHLTDEVHYDIEIAKISMPAKKQ